ncbi:MAG: winged helix-turn-helix domain-containing protein [Thermocrispum sp.]
MPAAQEALRLRAVAALAAGRDRGDVAAVLGVSLKAVDTWWTKWQLGGRAALVMRPRGKQVGVHQVLGEAEQAAVRQAILDHRPCEVGLSGQLWTRRLVGELIAKLCRVRLTEPGVGKYLKRWGLSIRRPDKRAVEQVAVPTRTARAAFSASMGSLTACRRAAQPVVLLCVAGAQHACRGAADGLHGS